MTGERIQDPCLNRWGKAVPEVKADVREAHEALRQTLLLPTQALRRAALTRIVHSKAGLAQQIHIDLLIEFLACARPDSEAA